MRRHRLLWLVEKEWRELFASRSWWVMLLVIGPLVGFSFISAMQTYAEASGLHGTSAGVGEAFSPLVGIWAPTFSASELAAAFLLPFVAIGLIASDRQSGASKLESQQPLGAGSRLSVKALVLLGGWLLASVPTGVAIALWKAYGGVVYWPEILTAAGGHLVNALLTIGLAAATASVAEHPSTAAILTLAVTVGTWILNFVAAVHGGVWETFARYTPTAMVAEFQRGLVRLDVLIAALTLAAGGIVLAAIWMRAGLPNRRRFYESFALGVAILLLMVMARRAEASWDLSESRASSFSRADEQALASIQSPLRMEVHLAPEDPRRVDLEYRALSKLRRAMPRVDIRYLSRTSIGLFEQTSEGYGEIRYDLGGRQAVSRATTAEAVLETIYDLAEIQPPDPGDPFRGHPLAVAPSGAGYVFYGAWPAVVLAGAVIIRRRRA